MHLVVRNTWFYLFLEKLKASDYLYFDLAADSDEGDFYSACDSSPLDAFFVAQPAVACVVSYHLHQEALSPHRVEPGAHHLHHLTYWVDVCVACVVPAGIAVGAWRVG